MRLTPRQDLHIMSTRLQNDIFVNVFKPWAEFKKKKLFLSSPVKRKKNPLVFFCTGVNVAGGCSVFFSALFSLSFCKISCRVCVFLFLDLDFQQVMKTRLFYQSGYKTSISYRVWRDTECSWKHPRYNWWHRRKCQNRAQVMPAVWRSFNINVEICCKLCLYKISGG